ncbi:MAG TPA: L-2-hydroxyglutarate oxidase [Caldithrix abyssi]|uniref:L-2-hydroxyglutarate oxidase n=1 Tax=Caldithrix abyssi TaxID=187145 RepID=A0A7V5PP03_CALAY|nr:L-2-hydroxyglutarate oxidase [Caldithrix abyssi]
MKAYDITIIGGGIVGMAAAMALSKNSKLKIAVIEAESGLARHQTGNNSGVIHSGLYYKPGSLKAQNCVEGRQALYRFCEQHDIAHDRCGKVVVATRQDEIPNLNELERRGKANGLIGLKRLSSEEIREYEPHVNGIDGLYVPETGIVDYTQVTEAYARLVKEAGNDILLDTRFKGLVKKDRELVLETNQNPIHTKNLINCAGLHSDRVAKKCGVDPQLKIVPFRGEYYELKPDKHHLVRNLIYPVPDPSFPFLGVHFTRMIHGGVEAGPNAVLAFKREGYTKFSFSLRDTAETFTYPGFLRLAGKYMRTGLGEFYRSFFKNAFVKALQRLIPEITADDIVPGGAGVRAQALEKNGALVDDFRIVQAEHMVHVLNAPSPAATASISIGEKIAALALESFR